jgi:hypothetical protein
VIKYLRPVDRAQPVGRGATVAQRTLDPLILVRIRTPQPDFEAYYLCKKKIKFFYWHIHCRTGTASPEWLARRTFFFVLMD